MSNRQLLMRPVSRPVLFLVLFALTSGFHSTAGGCHTTIFCDPTDVLAISPGETTLGPGQSVVFTYSLNGAPYSAISWSASGGTIASNPGSNSSTATYTAPSQPGDYVVTVHTGRVDSHTSWSGCPDVTALVHVRGTLPAGFNEGICGPCDLDNNCLPGLFCTGNDHGPGQCTRSCGASCPSPSSCNSDGNCTCSFAVAGGLDGGIDGGIGGGDGGTDGGSGSCTVQVPSGPVEVPRGGSSSTPFSPICNGTAAVTGATGNGYPAGVTVHDPVDTLTFSAAQSVAPGTYSGNVLFTFSSGSPQTVPLTVLVGDPAISIAPNPTSLIVSPGSSAQTTVTLAQHFGAAGDTTITVAGLPSGVSASPLTLLNGTPSGLLTLTAASNAALVSGVAATVNAVSGTLNASATLTVSVQPPPPGALDPGFGTGGISSLHITPGSADDAKGAALAANDAIVVVGTTAPADGGNSSAFVARFNAGGALDTTFNGTGIATFSWGNGGDTAYAVSVNNANQTITVIGQASGNDFGVARFTSAGVLDSTFGSGGLALGGINFGGALSGYVDPAGNIVAGGYGNYGGVRFLVARFLANGSGLDTSFGAGNGYVTVDFSSGGFFSGYAQAVAPWNGNIVAAGYAGDPPNSGDFALVELAGANGALVPGFGDAGVALIRVNNEAAGYAAAIQSNNILVTGQTYAANEQFLTLRALGSTGGLDPSFGTGGLANTPFSGASEAHALALQTDGKILTAGFAYSGAKQNVGVARMSGMDGSLDTSFTGSSGVGNGLVQLPVTSGADRGNALVLQSSGRIIVVGTGNLRSAASSIFVARLLN